MDLKRDIPDSVTRQLRKEAQFGCCICGFPFIEYHHIIEFAEKKHHDPVDMMALCPTHHHLATVHGITEKEQRKWKNNPYNKLHGFTHGQLYLTEGFIGIEVGTNYFAGEGFKFKVNNHHLLQLETDEDGKLLVSVDLYDMHDNLLVSIIRNEWITWETTLWDLEYKFNQIIVKSKKYEVSLILNAKVKPIFILGKIYKDGHLFQISKDALHVNHALDVLTVKNMGFACVGIEIDTKKVGFAMVPTEENSIAAYISEPNIQKRIEDTIAAYKQIKSMRNK